MLKDFLNFARRGNVIDLAVAVIIGGAFGKIVTSFVNDIITPLLGLILGRIDFSSLSFTIGESTVAYGLFLQSIIDFLIVAFCIFIVVRQFERFKKKAPPPPAAQTEEVKLLTEIRDLLKK